MREFVCAQAGIGAGSGISFASFRRFWTVAARRELVVSTRRTSQPEPVEAQDALEMCEQHLDLLAFTPRRHVGLSLGDITRNVSSLFVD